MGSYWIFNTFVPILQLFILVIAVGYFLKSRWFKGFAGEMLVHLLVKIHLDKAEYHVLKNVTLSAGDGTTQIDHLIVSRYGVFVIETKNMQGWIFGDARQRRWTQKIFRFTKKFPNPLHQNHTHVKTLQSLLAVNDQQVFSVVVFVGNSTFKTDMPENVIHLARLIRFIKAKDQQVLFDADVKMILSTIEAERLTPSRKTNRLHVQHIRQIVNLRKIRRSHFQSEMTAPIAFNHDDRRPDIDHEPAFTDSWQDRSWRSEDIDAAFTDRACR